MRVASQLSACALAISLGAFMFSTKARAAERNFTLRSPDQRIEIQIRVGNRINYDVSLKGKLLLQDASLAMRIGDKNLGENAQVKSATKQSVDKMLEPVVRQKFAKLRESYNEIRLDLDGGYAVVFRAYPEGVAYRFETSLGGAGLRVFSEESAFRFPSEFTVFYPEEESMFSHNERKYLARPLLSIPSTAFATLPAVV
ncbi:MAG TPA: glycoside hydrolase family 97 N-terminal domain-containing protein, partial [Candidatus Acidoferrum sp.]|nr:glycoside hydrolase family 97 N-terminal domain-containing protein [Candidatus Acidoferrum sp.]